MFSQAPEEPARASSHSSHKQKSIRNKRKKQKQKNKKKRAQIAQVNQSFSNNIPDWSDSFTMASTWQLRHQVAIWKSKASALEYENQVLRETLRHIYVNGGPNENSDENPNRSWNVESNQETMDCKQSYIDSEPSDIQVNDSDDSEESEYEYVIDDEYMAFLKQNVEFRKARDELKKKEADEERMLQEQAVMKPRPPSDRIDEYKELYGDSWQRIAALDTHFLSEFMSLCDREKPAFWPNIPLNIRF